MAMPPAYRQIRALYDDSTIRVYQAYNETIASEAVLKNRFDGIAGFKPSRATWIKPSFCWMAYRSGYSLKDVNQARILAIDIQRSAFEKMLAQSVVNRHDRGGESRRHCDVVIQWDPERGIDLERLSYRSIQIGIQGDMALWFARGDPIKNIDDVTTTFLQIKSLLDQGRRDEAEMLLPIERPYPLSDQLQVQLGMKE